MLQYLKLSLGLITLLFLALFSCRSNESKPESSEIDYRSGMSFPNFKERNTGLGRLVRKNDTLKIIVEFSECGEWGGGEEKEFLFNAIQIEESQLDLQWTQYHAKK